MPIHFGVLGLDLGGHWSIAQKVLELSTWNLVQILVLGQARCLFILRSWGKFCGHWSITQKVLELSTWNLVQALSDVHSGRPDSDCVSNISNNVFGNSPAFCAALGMDDKGNNCHQWSQPSTTAPRWLRAMTGRFLDLAPKTSRDLAAREISPITLFPCF